jgi:pyrophosphatase PpaX
MTAGAAETIAFERLRFLIFDLDGTLTDSIGVIIKTFRETFRALGIPDRSDAQFLSQVGRPLRRQMQDVDPERAQELFDTYRRLYWQFRDEMPRDFNGIRAVAAELERRGYPLAVVTSKKREGTMHDLDHCGLTPFFSVVITADDTDEHKPSPQPVLEALQRLGAAREESTYIGDSPFDIGSARAAGVLAGAVEWSPFPREVLEKENPDYWVPTPQSLLEIFPGPPPPSP